MNLDNSGDMSPNPEMMVTEDVAWSEPEEAPQAAEAEAEFTDDVAEEPADPFDEEPEAEEPEEVEDSEESADEEEEAEPETEVEESPEDKTDFTPRANDRIRKLVAEKKETEAQNAQLAEMVQALRDTLQQSHQLQQTAYDQQQAQQEQYATAQQEQQFMDQLKQYGYDESDMSHQLALRAFKRVSETEQKLAQALQVVETLQNQTKQVSFESTLGSEVTAGLKGLEVPDGALEAVRQRAAEKAQFKGISAEEAAKEAVSEFRAMVLPYMGKKAPAPKTRKADAVPKELQKVIASKGNTVGRKKGSSTKKRKPNPSSLENDIFGFDSSEW